MKAFVSLLVVAKNIVAEDKLRIRANRAVDVLRTELNLKTDLAVQLVNSMIKQEYLDLEVKTKFEKYVSLTPKACEQIRAYNAKKREAISDEVVNESQLKEGWEVATEEEYNSGDIVDPEAERAQGKLARLHKQYEQAEQRGDYQAMESITEDIQLVQQNS